MSPAANNSTTESGRLALVGLLGTAALLCAAGLWWLTAPDGQHGELSGSQGGASALAASPAAFPSGQPLSASGAPWQGSGAANGAANGAADSVLAPGLRMRLEEILLEASTGYEVSDPAALQARMLALVPRYFPAELAGRANELIGRYVAHRVELGKLKPPANPSDPRALHDALEARQRLRESFFTPEEYEALFAQEAQLDRYTLARIEIERNPALTAAQKAAALQEAEKDLDPAQRQLRAEALAHVSAAAQTGAFDAKSVPDSERFAQRSVQFGNAAALQLAELDRSERDWQTRLDSYLNAQASNATPAQLQQVRSQLFSEQEQLRIEAALALRQLAVPANGAAAK